jgi:predicted ATPase
MRQSEIRDSTTRRLLDKVQRQNYQKFLLSLRLEKIRMFLGAIITFDFPVVALIGPNGGGKTTILGACGCIYSKDIQKKVFQRSSIGDESMEGWSVQYDVIDKDKCTTGAVRGTLSYDGNEWINGENSRRQALFLSLMRTLPLAENPNFHIRGRLTRNTGKASKYKSLSVSSDELPEEISKLIRTEGAHVLGKSLSEYDFFEVKATIKKLKTVNQLERVRLPDGRVAVVVGRQKIREKKEHTLQQTMYTGKRGLATYSELNFGAGESSVLRIIAEIESIDDGSLVLIDEIENGLHPIAVHRLVEYLIDVSDRKRIQVIFTTHSDYALDPLPGEAIWACLDGQLQRGKLTVASLRAISGRIDKRLAIFVEDNFAENWLLAIIRERLGEKIDEIGVYAVKGDGNALRTHLAHMSNPAVTSPSMCILDGDSRQADAPEKGVLRLPGGLPETTIFNSVLANIQTNIALLTVACQRPLGRQAEVESAIQSVSHTNRDPHLLFAQVGAKLGFVPEAIARGAFLSVWMQENMAEVDTIVSAITSVLKE